MATAKKPVAKKKAPGKKAAPVKAQPTELTELEQRFAEEYLVDLNGTQAYLRVKPGAAEPSARVSATRLLAKANVQERIAQLKAERSERTGITADRVVQEAWNILTADPRELMEFHVGCCRYCWGQDFGYQRTNAEYRAAKDSHAAQLRMATTAKERTKLGTFNPMGGPGFEMTRAPNSLCPSCGGTGEGRSVFKDTRTISAAAASLFAGVKETKEGREIRLHSKDAAMDKLFRHFGIYNDKLQLTMPTAVIKDMTGRKPE